MTGSKPDPKTKSQPASRIRFRDISDTTGITFVHCSGDGEDTNYPTLLGSGVALLDYDGDGRLDLYFATTRNFPLDAPTTSQGNRLYRNMGDNAFEDVTEAAGVGHKGFTHAAISGDVNNDGRPDLFLSNYGPNVLYLNQGGGRFLPAVDAFPPDGPPWSTGAVFFDYDRDGWLDLYICCYGQWTLEAGPRCIKEQARTHCSPLQISPVRHYLYHNRGGGSFEDATRSAGVFRTDGRGMGAVAFDANRDGWLDLFVANDLSPNFLFLNRGDGTFEDVSERSGAAFKGSGAVQGSMGVDAEDVDGDGLPELFVTNFSFEPDTFYHNIDGRSFQDVTNTTGTAIDSTQDVGWGCALADLDLDSNLDILVVNGRWDVYWQRLAAIGSRIKRGMGMSTSTTRVETPKVWQGLGGPRFQLVTDAGPFFSTPTIARGAAFGDLDNDGDIDVVVSRMDQTPVVLLNESQTGHWIRFELISRWANRPAIGAEVAVHLGGRVLYRQLKGSGSYCSSNDPRILVGLGETERVDRVEIRWPGGTTTTLNSPAIETTHRIVEPKDGP
jgi:hypothetical protein